MSTKLKIYLGVLFFIMAGMVYIDASRPQPIDWTKNFSPRSKTPYGLFVFNEEIAKLSNNKKIEVIPDNLYNYYINHDFYLEENSGFIYIDNEFNLDPESLEYLFDYTAKGNNVLLACSYFPERFLDTLSIERNSLFYDENATITFHKNKNKFISYTYDKGTEQTAFYDFPKKAKVFSSLSKDKKEHINGLSVPFGKGKFILFSEPIIFTNYHLLKNQELPQNVLQTIQKEKLFIYSPGLYNGSNVGSPMKFILSKPALRWAWYFSLLGLLVFMFFNAKRRQAIIPIKEPKTNTSIAFIKTIGNLYFLEKNYANIMEKKGVYWLEKIRNNYGIDTHTLNETFINRVHQKTKIDTNTLKEIIVLLEKAKQNNTAIEKDLITLNKAIEKTNI
jgi:hypothetical protein